MNQRNYQKELDQLLVKIDKEYPGKIDIVEADYDSESFYEMAKGYEKEPECGKRCFL